MQAQVIPKQTSKELNTNFSPSAIYNSFWAPYIFY